MLTNVHFNLRKASPKAFQILFYTFFLAPIMAFAQQDFAKAEILWQGDTTLVFRGISALSDQVIWASSNQGVVVKSEDGGINWKVLKIPGGEGLQFRDIHVFNTKTALIMSSGWPSRIYKTADAGLNWRLVYENNDNAVFLDAFDFWPDSSGICFGDPVNGKFFILKTNDFGDSWTEIEGPQAEEGEAGFAASGTSLVCYLNGFAMIVSGGSRSMAYYTINKGDLWLSIPLKITSGSPSTGAFGAAYSEDNMLFVGGDYANDSLKDKTAEFWDFTGQKEPPKLIDGLPYQSAAVFVNDSIAVSVGTPGCHISRDGGLTWKKFTDMPLHTITKTKTGNAVFAAGPKGRIVKIVVDNKRD